MIPEGSRHSGLLMPHLLEVSNLGVLAGEGDVQGPAGEGVGCTCPLCFPAHSLLSDTPHVVSPVPLSRMQAAHIHANTPSSFCRDGHMGSSWITGSFLWGLKGAGLAGSCLPGTPEWDTGEKQQVHADSLSR